MYFYNEDHPENRMRKRCYELGKLTPDKVPHKTLMKMLAKIIVEEKVRDDDAFEMASKAFAEGFNGLGLGDLKNDTDITSLVSS